MPEKHVPDVLSTKYRSRGFPHSNHDMEVLRGLPWSNRAIFSSKHIAQVIEFEVKYTKFIYTYLLCWITLVCKQTFQWCKKIQLKISSTFWNLPLVLWGFTGSSFSASIYSRNMIKKWMKKAELKTVGILYNCILTFSSQLMLEIEQTN